jgi:hypothetical protein
VASQDFSATALALLGSGPDSGTREAAPLASDVDHARGSAAFVFVTGTGERRFGTVVLCGRSRSGTWSVLMENGEEWPNDPSAQPRGEGIVSMTSTFGTENADGIYIAAAGVVGHEVTSLVVASGFGSRAVSFDKRSGTFVIAVAGEPATGYSLLARAASGAEDRVEYHPPGS